MIGKRIPLIPRNARLNTFRFTTDSSVDFILDGETLATGLTLPAPVHGIGFMNWMAGPGSERNFLFNDITVTAPAEAGPASRVRVKELVAVPETLLSTNAVFTLVPTNDIAVTARFVPVDDGAFAAWAAARGIDNPWTIDSATGLSWPEQYLLETNAVPSLQETHPDGTYTLNFAPGEHGITARIEVSDTLHPSPIWRIPTPEELPPLDSTSRRYLPTPTNTPPRLFLRLVLLPLEATTVNP